MTKDEFERQYAERSGATVEWLHDEGLSAIPCDCGEAGCEGWQMIHADEEQVNIHISVMASARALAVLMEAWYAVIEEAAQ